MQMLFIDAILPTVHFLPERRFITTARTTNPRPQSLFPNSLPMASSSSFTPTGLRKREDGSQQQLQSLRKVHPSELPGERNREGVRQADVQITLRGGLGGERVHDLGQLTPSS